MMMIRDIPQEHLVSFHYVLTQLMVGMYQGFFPSMCGVTFGNFPVVKNRSPGRMYLNEALCEYLNIQAECLPFYDYFRQQPEKRAEPQFVHAVAYLGSKVVGTEGSDIEIEWIPNDFKDLWDLERDDGYRVERIVLCSTARLIKKIQSITTLKNVSNRKRLDRIDKVLGVCYDVRRSKFFT